MLFEDSSDLIPVNTDNIEVTALNDGGLDSVPGLRFDVLNDVFLVDGDGFLDTLILCLDSMFLFWSLSY